ncbi:MAG: hypothetical protein RLZZ618_3583 [Pseudomonadota bacterium]
MNIFSRRPAAIPDTPTADRRWVRVTLRVLLGIATAGATGVLLVAIAGALLYQRQPDLSELIDYRPKQPLRVFTSDGVEIGVFGTERRYLMPISRTPKLMQDAVLAIEDKRFRDHVGVDIKGVLRAAVANFVSDRRGQGGSTITQQVARNFYLSARRTYMRKINEMLLAIKIERRLSKDQVLELYMNQIYLGHRAYGFEAAAQAYFGKTLADLSVAECAMLAGLPQNPNYANPVVSPEKARRRQLLVLTSMQQAGVITAAQADAARAEPLQIRRDADTPVHAEYVAEMVRQIVFAQYGESTYTSGMKVTTTLRSTDQQAAVKALRKGVLDYERRQPYRGPEEHEDLPEGMAATDAAAAQVLAEYADDAELRLAVVIEASPREVVATLASGEVVRISGEGLKQALPALAPRAQAPARLRRGSVIRVAQDLPDAHSWAIRHWPDVQGALVAMTPHTGEVRALVGGFDFGRNQFNHAFNAWRQPGSAFKPFLYSAALEHGVMPSTLINDAPLVFAPTLDSPYWDPRNSDGTFDGPLSLRQALARSKNLVSIRLVQMMGTPAARDWTARFGFDPQQQPDNLTLALGAGSTTPWQLASAYAVLANGGFSVKPLLIERITDARDQPLFEGTPQPLTELTRAVPARNAFIVNDLLQEVTRSGTAAKAQAQLRRGDLYGKTGTTNDAVDAWFAGFQPSVVAVVWIGYDTPRSLGARESGGGLALPIWIDFMRQALLPVPSPLPNPAPPLDVVKVDGDWRYREWAFGGQRTHVGFDEATDALTDAVLQPK